MAQAAGLRKEQCPSSPTFGFASADDSAATATATATAVVTAEVIDAGAGGVPGGVVAAAAVPGLLGSSDCKALAGGYRTCRCTRRRWLQLSVKLGRTNSLHCCCIQN